MRQAAASTKEVGSPRPWEPAAKTVTNQKYGPAVSACPALPKMDFLGKVAQHWRDLSAGPEIPIGQGRNTSCEVPSPGLAGRRGAFSPRWCADWPRVAQGRTDAEITAELFISVSTVRTHLDRIRDKSGSCKTRRVGRLTHSPAGVASASP
jgi:hypothetical protein